MSAARPRRAPPTAFFPFAVLLVACSGGDAGSTGGTDSGSGGTASAGSASMGSVSSSQTSAGSGGTGTGTSSSTSTTSSSSSGGSTTGGGGTDIGCDPLPPPRGPTLTYGPGDADDLPGLVDAAAPGTTILLQDGTYTLSAPIHVVVPDLTIRSAGGDPSAVVVDGNYAVGENFLVEASNFTLAELTTQRATWHPIHVTGGATADTTGTRIYRVRVVDPGQQGIKINTSGPGFFTDDGEIACSSIELTDAGRPQVSDCYTGGIDAHAARGWVVRDNHIEGFWCDQGLSEHAVHFWVTSRDTVVERNVIVDCARGVGFGLGEMGNGNTRDYGDDPCPGATYLGHIDGVIRNNFVWAGRAELFASQSGFDSGIALEQACGTAAVHNTIVALQQPFVSIEYRWANTDALIGNNLVTHGIVERDGATAQLLGNLENAPTSHFLDAPSGDLHLATGSAAIDAGAALPMPVTDDIDASPRDDGAPDVGADEWPP